MKKDIADIINKLTWLWFGLIPFLSIFIVYIFLLAISGQFYPLDIYDFFEGMLTIILIFFIPGCLIGIFYQKTRKEKRRYILGFAGVGFALGWVADMFVITFSFPIFLFPIFWLVEPFIGSGERAGWVAMGLAPFIYSVILAFIGYLYNRKK